MTYKTQQVADLLGISAEALKNYERSGIIKPARDRNSGYRQFSYMDICSLIRVKMYREFGFSLKDIEIMINDMDLDKTLELLESRKQLLNHETLLLSESIRSLDSMISQLKDVESLCDRIIIKSEPAFYRLEFSKNGVLNYNPHTVSLVREWMSYSPFLRFSSRYRGKDVYGGLRMDACYASLFCLEEDPLIHYYPESLCLSTIVKEGDRQYTNYDCLNQLKEFSEEHRFILDEDFIGHTIIGLNRAKNYHHYREISVKISY